MYLNSSKAAQVVMPGDILGIESSEELIAKKIDFNKDDGRITIKTNHGDVVKKFGERVPVLTRIEE